MNRQMFLFTLAVFSVTLSIHAYAATIATDGLVSYWTFNLHNINDGIAEDVWGENDATIMGNPEVAEGYLKQGLEFDGSGGYVILDNIGNVQNHTGPSTFEFWVKTSYDKRNTLFKVIEKLCKGDNIGDGRGWGIHLNASMQAPNFPNLPNIVQVGGNDGIIHKEGNILIEYVRNSEETCGHSRSTHSVPISDDKWHHIVYMYNWYIDEFSKGKHKEIIFIDGIRKSWELPEVPGRPDRAPNPGKLIPYTQPVFLGAINDNGKARRFFRGVFDEVRVYDRMLTDEEVLQNFQSGIGLSVEPNQKLPTVWGALKARR